MGILLEPLRKTGWGFPQLDKLCLYDLENFTAWKDGRAVESYLFFDIIDLMRQIDRWPLPVPSVGEEFFIPGPITCDGIVMAHQDDDGKVKKRQYWSLIC